MINDNLILSFNGEIYNYKELKNDLEENGYKFKTTDHTNLLEIQYSWKQRYACLGTTKTLFNKR